MPRMDARSRAATGRVDWIVAQAADLRRHKQDHLAMGRNPVGSP
jgi:hypothetical protein